MVWKIFALALLVGSLSLTGTESLAWGTYGEATFVDGTEDRRDNGT